MLLGADARQQYDRTKVVQNTRNYAHVILVFDSNVNEATR